MYTVVELQARVVLFFFNSGDGKASERGERARKLPSARTQGQFPRLLVCSLLYLSRILFIAYRFLESSRISHYLEQKLVTCLEVIYQTRGRVFQPISKHREVTWVEKRGPAEFLNFEVFGNWMKYFFKCLI